MKRKHINLSEKPDNSDENPAPPKKKKVSLHSRRKSLKKRTFNEEGYPSLGNKTDNHDENPVLHKKQKVSLHSRRKALKKSEFNEEGYPEIWREVMQYLPIQDIAHVSELNNSFNRIANDNILWQKKAQERGMPETWEKENPLNKERLLTFLANERKVVSESYPPQLIQALGGVNKVAAIPRTMLGTKLEKMNRTLRCIWPDEIQGQKMWRGVDKYGRHFITFCLRVGLAIEVRTLHQLNPENESIWVVIGNLPSSASSVGYNYATEATYEYVGRLVRGEPCGFCDINYFLDIIESTQKTNADGKSRVWLTEQIENGAELSAKKQKI